MVADSDLAPRGAGASVKPDVVQLTLEPISLAALLAAMGHDITGAGPGDEAEGGALVTFSGIVRATEGQDRIAHLDYEAYESMALGQMKALVVRARERWPLLRVGLVHRTGAVPAAEASVLVAVLAGHRAEAFEAARFLIDELKKSVPIWKRAPIEPKDN